MPELEKIKLRIDLVEIVRKKCPLFYELTSRLKECILTGFFPSGAVGEIPQIGAIAPSTEMLH